MGSPLFSILLPVFNGMPYLPAAVESILSQTVRDLEVLVLDDGSTDESADYVSGLTDPRIRYLRLPRRGLSYALNSGIELARADLIARMDADDVSLPDRLERQHRLLRDRPEVGVVGTQIRFFTRDPRQARFPSRLYTEHDPIRDALLRREHTLCHPSTVFRREVLRRLGIRVTEIGEDWDLFLRASEITRMANLPGVHYLYRLHRRSITSSSWKRVMQWQIYAVECARRREQGLPERSMQEFQEGYDRRGIGARIAEAVESGTLAVYRRGQMDLIEGAWLGSAVCMGVSAALAPSRSFHRLRRELRRGIRNSAPASGRHDF